MAKKKTEEQDTEFPKKWAKHLSSEWMDIAQGFSTEEIKKKLVQSEQAISQTEKDMDADLELSVLKERQTEIKEEYKEKSKVYKESIDGCQAQIKYYVHLLESRGESVK